MHRRSRAPEVDRIAGDRGVTYEVAARSSPEDERRHVAIARIARIATVIALGIVAAVVGCRKPVPSSTLIVGARLVDGSGTGSAAPVGALRLDGDRIVELGELEPLEGETVVEAHGLLLAPGFIDTHSHHDIGLFEEPDALAAVSQGITTIVAGQDGGSTLPLRELFERFEESPAAVNLASYSGHNTLRAEVLGRDFRRPASPEEVERMSELLAGDLEAGALGLATGLEYDPGIYSETSEVIELARVAAAAGGRYISHVRSEDRNFWAAVEELLEIGREARIPVQISHMKLAMKSLWGKAPRLLERLEQAREDGIEVTADVYPYTYWQSTMTVLFPERDFTDREATEFALTELAPPEGMWFARFDAQPRYVGMTLSQIAEERDADPVDVYLQLLAEAEAAADDPDDWGESIIATSMHQDDVAELLAWEHTNVCSDGGLRGRHPRGFGSFPRALRGQVINGGRLSWEAAIHRMTELAAAHVGIEDRGRLEPGAYADLVLIDPTTIADRATPDNPQMISDGIVTVWVNGRPVWNDGATTGEHPGRVVRRPAS